MAGPVREWALGGTRAVRAEQLSLPLDSLGFVRRECPNCHRLFKVRSTNLESHLVFRRVVSHLAHANVEEAQGRLERRTCPYCAKEADEDAWFTAEQRAFLDAHARALGQELRFEQLAHIERSLAVNPNPTFVAVKPAPAPEGLRAEPDDMRVVPLLCCGEELKVSDGWLGAVRCFYCGIEHELCAALWRERLKYLVDL